MERFGSNNDDQIIYSDRFGFTSTPQEIAVSNEKKKPYKIHISSDGKTTQVPIKSSLADELTEVLKSPWFDNHREFANSFIQALKRSPLPDHSIDPINQVCFSPHFIGSQVHPDSIAKFEGKALTIKIAIQEGDKKLDSQIIQLLGNRFYELPLIPVTLSIVSSSSVLGYLHGQIYHEDQKSFIEVLRLESRKGDPLTWIDLPGESYLLGRIDIVSDIQKSSDLPSVIEEGPSVRMTMTENQYEFIVNVLTVPVKDFYIDLKDIEREILVHVRDSQQNVLCYLSAHLHKDGLLEVGDLIPLKDEVKVTWEDLPTKTLYFVIERKITESFIDEKTE